MKKEKILVTGGHLTPAIAVIDELQNRGYNNIVWVGHKYTMIGDTEPGYEYKVITERNIPFINLETGKLYRYFSLKGIRSFLRIPKGFFQALGIIVKEKPDLIISFGGYLALPVVLAGKLKSKTTVTHEQTITVGLANLIISKLADHIFITWPESKKHFPISKTLITGNPVRKSIFKVSNELFNFGNSLPIIYVTGGNQGAHILNETLKEILEKLLPKYNIVHQCGSNIINNDLQSLQKVKEKLPESLKSRYRVAANINEDEIGTVLNKTDLVIGRAGANTVYELLALKKFAILIPIPFSAHNEQLLNAGALQKTGLGKVIEQKVLSPSLLFSSIEEIMKEIKIYETNKKQELIKIQENVKKIFIPDAANRICNYIETIFKN